MVDRVPVTRQAVKGCTITAAQRIHHLHYLWIRVRNPLLSREGIGPLRTLVNPIANEIDLLGRQGAGRGHLCTHCSAGNSQVEHASSRVPAPDDDTPANLECGAAAIKTEAGTLLRRPVAGIATFLKYGPNIAREIDFRRFC